MIDTVISTDILIDKLSPLLQDRPRPTGFPNNAVPDPLLIGTRDSGPNLAQLQFIILTNAQSKPTAVVTQHSVPLNKTLIDELPSHTRIS